MAAPQPQVGKVYKARSLGASGASFYVMVSAVDHSQAQGEAAWLVWGYRVGRSRTAGVGSTRSPRQYLVDKAEG